MSQTTSCEFCGKDLPIAQRGEAPTYGMVHERRACHDCAKGPAFQSEWYFFREAEKRAATKVVEEDTARAWATELARRADAEKGRVGEAAKAKALSDWLRGLDQAVDADIDYMRADPEWGTVTLDGIFTPDTLRAIADYFDEHPWGDEK